MTCDYCGDTIDIDDDYYHYPNLDLDYHVGCEPNPEDMLKKEFRRREE